MSALRALVTSTDPDLRRATVTMFEEAGCEVLTADSGVSCIERARADVPDLVVLVPPLLWGSIVGVLAVLHEDPRTRRVPVLVLGSTINEGPLPRTPRLFLANPTQGTDALSLLVNRVCARTRHRAPAAPNPPTP